MRYGTEMDDRRYITYASLLQVNNYNEGSENFEVICDKFNADIYY
jgi:hypothetical protein